MNISDAIYEFGARFNDTPNSVGGRPNWVDATFRNLCSDAKTNETFVVTFDFKHDSARKAFGALCCVVFNSKEHWMITTARQL